MIVLLAKNTVRKGKETDFLALAQEMVRQSRKESGCIGYELVQDEQDAQVYYFIEKYADADAVAQHRETAHFQTLVPQIAALRTKPSEVSTCRVIEETE